MNRKRSVFVVLLVGAVILSAAACYPLVNVLRGNPAGWFTMDNVDDYGDDLDARAVQHGGEIVVFTGHPGYVMGSENARLVFDMPRNHYYASTFNDTRVGDEWYAKLTRALRQGRADITIGGPMTEVILEQNSSAATAFRTHYCRADEPDAQALYNRTHGSLYIYEPECPESRQPVIQELSQSE